MSTSTEQTATISTLSPPVPLTPSAFLEAMAARLDRLHEGTAGVLLRAVPVRSAIGGKTYGGFVYALLKDTRTGDVIDARVPEALAAGIEWNREAIFVGLLRYKVKQGAVRLECRVDAVHEALALRLPSKEELFQRWAEAAARPKRDLRTALQGIAPRLRVITGVSSVAVDDIRAQLKGWETDVTLDIVRVPITRPAEVVQALRQQATGTSVVVITRGGGESVHDLDVEELLAAVAASPIPTAVALGHASDDLALARVADASFPTPTAFGVWLRGCLEERRAKAKQAADLQARSRLEHLTQVRQLQATLARWRTGTVLAAVLGAVLVLWLLLGR